MTNKRFGIAAAVLVVDTALLLIVGAAMWNEAPSSADEAVGKGLVALGAALAIPALVIVCAFLESRFALAPAEEPGRSDWDAV